MALEVVGEAGIEIKPIGTGFQRQVDDLIKRTTAAAASLGRIPVGVDTTQATSSVRALGDEVEKSLLSRFRELSALALGGFGIAKVFQTIKDSVIGFNSQLDVTRTAFSVFLKDTEKANTLIEELKVLARSTPFEFADVLTGAQRLLAFQFPAERIKEILTTVGDAATGLAGGSADVVFGIVRALGQIQTKGRVQAEELLQLQERGVAAQRYLSEALGVSTAELIKLQEKGLIPADQAINAILEGISRDFGGLMEAQAKTLRVAISNFRDTITQTLSTIGRPFYDAFEEIAVRGSELLVELSTAFQNAGFAGDGGLFDALVGKAPEELQDTFESIFENLTDLGNAAQRLAPIVADVLGQFAAPVVVAFVRSLELLLDVVTPVITALSEMGETTETFVKILGAAFLINKFKPFFAGLTTGLRDVSVQQQRNGELAKINERLTVLSEQTKTRAVVSGVETRTAAEQREFAQLEARRAQLLAIDNNLGQRLGAGSLNLGQKITAQTSGAVAAGKALSLAVVKSIAAGLQTGSERTIAPAVRGVANQLSQLSASVRNFFNRDVAQFLGRDVANVAAAAGRVRVGDPTVGLRDRLAGAKVEAVKFREAVSTLGPTFLTALGSATIALNTLFDESDSGFGSIIDNVNTVAATAAAGFAVGGPWGAAVGAGLGLLIGGLNDAKKKTEELRRAAEEAAQAAFNQLSAVADLEFGTEDAGTLAKTERFIENQKLITESLRGQAEAAAALERAQRSLEEATTGLDTAYNGFITPTDDEVANLENAKKLAEQLVSTSKRAKELADSQLRDVAITLGYSAEDGDLDLFIEEQKKLIDEEIGKLETELRVKSRGLSAAFVESLNDPANSSLARQKFDDFIAEAITSRRITRRVPGVRNVSVPLNIDATVANPEFLFDLFTKLQNDSRVADLFQQTFEIDPSTIVSIEDLAAALDILDASAIKPTDSFTKLSDEIKAAAEASKTAKKAFEESALGLSVDASSAVESARSSLQGTLDDIANADTIDDVRSAVQGTLPTIFELSNAMRALGLGVDEQNAAIADYVTRIFETAEALGFPQEQLREILRLQGLIDSEGVTIDVQLLNYEETIAKLEAIGSTVRSLSEAANIGRQIGAIKEREEELVASIREGSEVAARSFTEGIRKADKSQQEAVDRYLKALAEAQERAEKALEAFRESIREAAKDLVKASEKFTGSALERLQLNAAVPTQRLTQNTVFRTDLLREFTQGIQALTQRGFNQSQLGLLGITGPESVRQIRSLLRSSPEELTALNQALRDQQAAAIKAAAITEGQIIADAITKALNDYFKATGQVAPSNLPGIINNITQNINSNATNPDAVAQAAIAQLESSLRPT